MATSVSVQIYKHCSLSVSLKNVTSHHLNNVRSLLALIVLGHCLSSYKSGSILAKAQVWEVSRIQLLRQ